jgi:hypothetical protein
MKKLLTLFCILALSSTLFIGCGKKDAETTQPETTQEESTEENTTDEESAEENSSPTVKDYVTENQAVFDAVVKAFEDQMNVSIEADGNTLYYRYQYLEDLGDPEPIKEALIAGMEQQEDTMLLVVEELSDFGIENPIVAVEYLDVHGEVITEFEFK